MKGIVGQTSIRVGRMTPSRPAATRTVATSPAATRTWTSARLRAGAAVSYAVPRTR